MYPNRILETKIGTDGLVFDLIPTATHFLTRPAPKTAAFETGKVCPRRILNNNRDDARWGDGPSATLVRGFVADHLEPLSWRARPPRPWCLQGDLEETRPRWRWRGLRATTVDCFLTRGEEPLRGLRNACNLAGTSLWLPDVRLHLLAPLTLSPSLYFSPRNENDASSLTILRLVEALPVSPLSLSPLPFFHISITSAVFLRGSWVTWTVSHGSVDNRLPSQHSPMIRGHPCCTGQIEFRI